MTCAGMAVTYTGLGVTCSPVGGMWPAKALCITVVTGFHKVAYPFPIPVQFHKPCFGLGSRFWTGNTCEGVIVRVFPVQTCRRANQINLLENEREPSNTWDYCHAHSWCHRTISDFKLGPACFCLLCVINYLLISSIHRGRKAYF